MKPISSVVFLLLMSCSMHSQSLRSPSKALQLAFSLNEENQPTYQVFFHQKQIIGESKLGYELKEQGMLNKGFSIDTIHHRTEQSTWKPVLGESATIENHFNEMTVALTHDVTKIKIELIFRAYNEGIAFRYRFPRQQQLNYFIVKEELTTFEMQGDHNTFWIPADFDSQEYAYNETKISEIDTRKIELNNGIGFKSIASQYGVQSPLMMKSSDGIYVNIFEAAVDNYPVMHLQCDTQALSFQSLLAPNAIGDLAYLQAPFSSPWRVVFVSDDARKIVSSKLILNLNEPCKIENTSYIKPMKYMGIWWDMHVGRHTWDYAGSQNAQNPTELKASGRHGATTERTKMYIDFAAEHGFDAVLVEGWNVGWEDWFGNWKEEVFDFTTPYPDFNVQEVTEYAKQKGISMIMHHETSGSASNYERRLDRAFDFMKKYRYPAVKTGYVGRIIPRGEYHDGQTMVNHYHHVVKRAAEYGLLVNSHESSRPTGMHRTWPNYIAAEAARGNEFNAWSIGNPPMHETILPFTRLLGGPMDYTPGIFELEMSYYQPGKKERVHTTLAKQLALYVTMYSPLQMAADLPENYLRYPDAFQFIKDVVCDWEESIYLEAEPGDYLTVARKEKNGDRWFIGAITDENARSSSISLDFLDPKISYEAIIYEDGENASWENNPKSYRIRKLKVNSTSKIELQIASGGGTAITINPLQ